jgi:hypothetical protein
MNESARRLYAQQLGSLVGNLQGLEFMLRALLAHQTKDATDSPGLFSLQVGQEVPVNSLADYRTLGELMKACEPWVTIDRRVIDMRDALAHGRLTSPSPEVFGTSRLIKFGRPKNSRTRVAFSEVVTLEWLKEQTSFVYEQMMAVLNCSAAAGIIEKA